MSKKIINILLICYLFIIYFAGVPETHTLSLRLKQMASTIAYMIGIQPSWSMFAPNPAKIDSKTFAEVTYEDNTMISRDIEPDVSGLFYTFRIGRWTKFAEENVRRPNLKALLPIVSDYVYRVEGENGRKVKGIKLVQKYKEVPAIKPDGSVIPILSDYPRPEKTKVLFEKNYEEKQL